MLVNSGSAALRLDHHFEKRFDVTGMALCLVRNAIDVLGWIPGGSFLIRG
jgi:hypothetical protein